MRFARTIAEKPIETIEGIVSIAVLLVGFWYISPFYHPVNSVQAQITESANIPQILGVAQIVMAIVLLFALFRPNFKKSKLLRSWMTFSIFILYLFYGLSSVFILGMGRVTWVHTFALALISGTAHLRLKWELKNHA
jgi:hypothetical protein